MELGVQGFELTAWHCNLETMSTANCAFDRILAISVCNMIAL